MRATIATVGGGMTHTDSCHMSESLSGPEVKQSSGGCIFVYFKYIYKTQLWYGGHLQGHSRARSGMVCGQGGLAVGGRARSRDDGGQRRREGY